MTPLRTRLAAATIGAGLVLAAPAAAWAGPLRSPSTPQTSSPSNASSPSSSTLEALRAKCLAAIDVRLPALAAARADVANDQHTTAEHKTALEADIDQTAARLQTLQGEIQADTELSALRDHCHSIFQDNRVFALVLPRARLVVGADTAGFAGDKLSDVAGKLADAIQKAQDAGRDVAQAKADLDAMKAQIASGVAAAGAVPGDVLGLTPADWNANHDVLTPARQSLRAARADLKVARDLAVKIRNELRTPTTTPPAPSSPVSGSPQA
ncbi:MAG TPA: hypothetical protein VFE55_11170 [Acidimicrobiia bacterium]|nr:hypothetical protein [Acidimicrobiia bacterium]